MKNLVKKLAVGAVAVACAFTLAACTPKAEPENNKPVEGDQPTQPTFAEQQITVAQNTFDSFYQKDGLFSEQPVRSAVVPRAYRVLEVENGTAETPAPTFEDVRNTLAKYNISPGYVKSLFNSYVADIFSYSQVQTSIINAFGEQALTDVYALTYDTVDWSSDKTPYGDWIKSTKLLSASFAGADLESGNVYCTQAHKSNGKLVLANLEYYYNSDDDMGVTTINKHSDGRFEYHYCSAGTFENLQAFGSYDSNGDITLTSFGFYCQKGVIVSDFCTDADKEIVYDYVKSEVARINGKIESLNEQNERERTVDGTEEAGDTQQAHVSTCAVSLDFSVLARMLIK